MPISRRHFLQSSAGAAILAAATPVFASQTKTPVITAPAGQIQGDTRNGVMRFLGVPYAQSIAGKNRFLPPQPVAPWSGVLQALSYKDSAPQQHSEMIGPSPVTPAFQPPEYVQPGDDCLVLNVWAPQKADGLLPVMVWLHGGGWVSGSGSCAIYDGENLASRGDVVVVTINHRLGASGLTDLSRVLGGEFVGSSNLGIRDILAALTWVNRNIAAFGGDPDLVTIFGESGGGWKVSTMLGVPAAKGLFHRAIIESGPLTRFQTPEQSDQVARAVLKALGVTAENTDKLDTLSAEDMIVAEAKVLAEMPMSMSAPGFPTGFWPVIDDDLITGHVFDQVAAPSSVDVPLLAGQNGTEFTLFMLGDKAAYSLDAAQLRQRLTGVFGEDDSPAILASYQRDFPDYGPSALWFRIYSDFAMGTLTSEILDVRASTGSAPVYAYRFDWQTPIYDGDLYSPHTIEIPFVFDNVNTQAGKVMTQGGEEAAALARSVSSAWVEFARTGKPAAAGLPEWPVYSREKPQSMHIDQSSKVRPYMDPAVKALFHKKLWAQAGLSG